MTSLRVVLIKVRLSQECTMRVMYVLVLKMVLLLQKNGLSVLLVRKYKSCSFRGDRIQ